MMPPEVTHILSNKKIAIKCKFSHGPDYTSRKKNNINKKHQVQVQHSNNKINIPVQMTSNEASGCQSQKQPVQKN